VSVALAVEVWLSGSKIAIATIVGTVSPTGNEDAAIGECGRSVPCGGKWTKLLDWLERCIDQRCCRQRGASAEAQGMVYYSF
jgi:hypothetical protein